VVAAAEEEVLVPLLFLSPPPPLFPRWVVVAATDEVLVPLLLWFLPRAGVVAATEVVLFPPRLVEDVDGVGFVTPGPLLFLPPCLGVVVSGLRDEVVLVWPPADKKDMKVNFQALQCNTYFHHFSHSRRAWQ